MPRPKLTAQEVAERKQQRAIHAREMRTYKKTNGICRRCDKPICKDSTVFCEEHLIDNRIRGRNTHRCQKIRARARTNNIDFNIEDHEFDEWLNAQEKQCVYCGIHEKELQCKQDKKQRRLTVDRKNNSIGYCLDNICLACFRCNNSKSNFFSYEEWMTVAKQFIRPRLDEYHAK